MKPALLLVVSLAANVALLAAIVTRPSLAPPAVRNLFTSGAESSSQESERQPASDSHAARPERRAEARPTASSTESQRTNLWAALDSEDLRTLVDRLRAAGFSRSVVLAIVNAKLEARFADRLKALTADIENAPFWKPDPMSSMFGMPKFWEEYSQISRERSKMLRELLGRDSMAWGGTDPATAQRRQFGNLPQEKIEMIQRINDDYNEMQSQLRASMQGITLPEDREKFALLEREKRADLAAILAPAELEEYEMRTSPVTSRLRPAVTLMNASEEEFRTLFKIQQAFTDRINPVTSGMVSSQMMEDRREAQRQMNEQIKAALPPNRFEDYMRASNPEFQQLNRIVQLENLPPETAVRAFALRDGIAAESGRIADNATMSFEQKRAALQALAQKARTQIMGTLGPTAGESYAQVARWITSLERGSAVAFNPDGSPTSRFIPAQPPAKK